MAHAIRSALAASLVTTLLAAAALARTPTPSHTPLPTPEPPTATLRGRVYDAAVGPTLPLHAAVVVFTRQPSGIEGVTYTGLMGEFELVVSQGDARIDVRVAADAYLPAQLTYFPATGDDVVDVALQPAPRAPSINLAVYDPSLGGLPAAIAGAEIRYTLYARGADTQTHVVLTNEAGQATFDLPIDVDEVVLHVSAAGYVPFLQSHSAPALRLQPVVTIELARIAIVPREFSGTVLDASSVPAVPIADAEVRYTRFSSLQPRLDGSIRTDPNGRYTIMVELDGQSVVDITATAAGFAARTAHGRAYDVPDSIDFALAPLGGVIRIEPDAPYVVVQCEAQLDVTITNVTPSADPLSIVDVALWHGYSQGEYGTGFHWDLSVLDLPVVLESGQSVTIPVTYEAHEGDFDSRLHVEVVSGAREGTSGIVIHGEAGPPLGNGPSCRTVSPSPTPTRTPRPIDCRGDCDGNHQVTINELLLAVGWALAAPASSSITCPFLDADGDRAISIAELVAAVDTALRGCPAE